MFNLTRAAIAAGLVVSFGSGASAQVLLIPNSGTGFDNIWSFDPFDGHLISNNAIPADGRMQQVIKVVESAGSLYAIDETADAVFKYDLSGNYQSTPIDKPTHDVDLYSGEILAGKLYLPIVAGTRSGTIQQFNLDGTGRTDWAAGLGTPRDIVFRANDALVGESGGDDILSLSLAGALNGVWHASDGATGIDFPNQLFLQASGNVLAAGFTAPLGIYEYDSNGAQLNFWPLNTSPRGVFRLGNGKILWAGGTRVGVLDPSDGSSVDVVNATNASFRFITPSSIPAPGAVGLLVLGAAMGTRRRR